MYKSKLIYLNIHTYVIEMYLNIYIYICNEGIYLFALYVLSYYKS